MDTAVEASSTSRVRRLSEVTAFVAGWVALGYLLPVDTDAYLLLGVPLTVAFQLVVRRRPLRELWIRAGRAFRLRARDVALAAVLAALPASLAVAAARAGAWTEAGWSACAAVGAVPAAWTLRHAPFGAMVRVAAPATVAGSLLMGLTALGAAVPIPGVAEMLAVGLRSVLLYLVVGFVLEEVTFRGALDAHVHHPGERRGLLSALVVSVLWGLWHLPLANPATPLWLTLTQLVVVHGVIGVLLSTAWRRTGTLAAPALAHALVDGVRNALLAGS